MSGAATADRRGILAGLAAGLAVGAAGPALAQDLEARARKIHDAVLVLDSHLDIPLNYGTGAHDPGTDGDTQVDLPTLERGGVDAAADILNHLGGTLEASVSAHLREMDPELAQKIQDKMFVFENLLDLDDRAIQLLLREIQSETLVVALKGTSEQLQDKIFKNMSQRAAEMLRDDLEAKGPVRLSEVETEQREILRIVRRLAEEGQIAMGGKGEEGLVQ